ncbi:3'-5' exonuclease family protein [Fodinicola feengrottensis]|uniref:hypothetical protein n=1 Tax=Fodinicola feengrottensis TaxID=435914 RepID=UPI0013D1BFD2|nr:hypothetical protein [Fodinicola feengrottensis]
MRTQAYQLAGDTVQIRFVETAADADEAVRWSLAQQLLAVDTETPHLLHFAADFRVRLAQFGNSSVAYVLPVERDEWSRSASRNILTKHKRMLGFNVPFDALAAGVDSLVDDAVELQSRMVDVGLISRLEDPRSKGQPGAAGHKLKDLCDVYVDPASPDTQEGLADFFASQSWGIKDSQKKPLGWGLVDLTEPVYWLYAGLDVILLSRLFPVLYKALKPSPSYGLLNFERQVQGEVMRPEQKGMLIDRPYATDLFEILREEERSHADAVARYGVKNANSGDQVAAALLAMGEEIPERTDGGKVKTDKFVLCSAAGRCEREGLGRGSRNPRAQLACSSGHVYQTSSALAELRTQVA